MRNQLLRDADWAGMAHGLELRVPLVDATLLEQVAPLVVSRPAMHAKCALINAPSVPLPREVTQRTKTGFGTPLGMWVNGAFNTSFRRHSKGIDSRSWSGQVLAAMPGGEG